MEDLKQAYKLLGLSENASKEEVEKKYLMLLRQSKSQERQGTGTTGESSGFDKVNRAYKLILNHENETAVAEINKQQYGKYKNMAGFAQKVDHFFAYYKVHVLVSILIIAGIIYGINTYMNHKAEQAELAKLPPIDLTVMFYGEYFLPDGGSDTKPLQEALLTVFPEWQRTVVHLAYVPEEMRSEHDMAMIQKSMLTLMTDKSDVYIMDKVNFEKLSGQGGLLRPLDEDAAAALKPLLSEDKLVRAQTKDDTQPLIYGIDISSSKFASQLPLAHNNKKLIAGIRIDAKDQDKALLFIERFLSESE
ncbi:J domain-containing protein [Paenibacillaceae bacterium]|nr:J domain-containing protein [Paenibacillaceae bacterium]